MIDEKRVVFGSASEAIRDTIEFFVHLALGLTALSPILLTLLALIAVNGLAIGRLQGWSRADSLYHAFINATTVGYGDFRPTVGMAKVLSVLNAFLGLLLTGVFVGVGVWAVELAVQEYP
ncbi:MAG: Ion channel protein [Rhodobacteraceae bacterium]|nr:Ion channel protein [Paracoccaceae bacterium]